MYWDNTYFLVLIGAVISAIASSNVSSTFQKFSTVNSARRVTAQDAAERILRGAGIYDVRIERIRGNLTDHYSPNEKVLRLSDSVYDLVLVNIVADVIIGLAPVLPRFLSPDSTLICSGILDVRLNDVLQALEKAGLTVTAIKEKEDWRSVTACRK